MSAVPSWLWSAGTWLVTASFAMFIGYFAGCTGERTRWQAQHTADSLATVVAIDSMETARDSLGLVLAALDTAYQRDTIELTRWRTRWDSVTVRWTDTLRRVDTLTIDRVIPVAKGTINACTQALGTCEARVGALAADTTLLRRQRDSVQSLLTRASKVKRWACGPGGGAMPTLAEGRWARGVVGVMCVRSLLTF